MQLGLGVFYLLLSLQLHLLLALPQNSMVADLNHEKTIGREPIVPKHDDMKVAVGGRGGAVGGRGGGGQHGSESGAGGDNGGGTKTPNGQGGGVIPVYAAGAMNHNRDHRQHGSSSGTTSCVVGSSCFVLILFTSFFFAC
ncbi:hypothetical protein DITRI_Ditri14bG0041000 [Diplodiscus trichospermus]